MYELSPDCIFDIPEAVLKRQKLIRSNFTFFEFSVSHRRKKLTEICERDSGNELLRCVLDHPNKHNDNLDPLWGLGIHPLSDTST